MPRRAPRIDPLRQRHHPLRGGAGQGQARAGRGEAHRQGTPEQHPTRPRGQQQARDDPQCHPAASGRAQGEGKGCEQRGEEPAHRQPHAALGPGLVLRDVAPDIRSAQAGEDADGKGEKAAPLRQVRETVRSRQDCPYDYTVYRRGRRSKDCRRRPGGLAAAAPSILDLHPEDGRPDSARRIRAWARDLLNPHSNSTRSGPGQMNSAMEFGSVHAALKFATLDFERAARRMSNSTAMAPESFKNALGQVADHARGERRRARRRTRRRREPSGRPLISGPHLKHTNHSCKPELRGGVVSHYKDPRTKSHIINRGSDPHHSVCCSYAATTIGLPRSRGLACCSISC